MVEPVRLIDEAQFGHRAALTVFAPRSIVLRFRGVADKKDSGNACDAPAGILERSPSTVTPPVTPGHAPMP